jgi:DNA-binding PadR family transcriptional regulator
VAEIADATGVAPGVLYQLRRRLLDDGAIVERVRDDGRKGYELTDG